MILLGRAHSADAQGASIGYLTEWAISKDIIDSASECLDALHCPNIKLSGDLDLRLECENRLSDVLTVDCILEPHCNWSSDPGQRGCFALCWHDSAKGVCLARLVIEKLAELMHTQGVCLCDRDERWIGTPRHYRDEHSALGLLMRTKCPAVIVECCHLSNADDAAWIGEIAHRQMVGRAIGEAVKLFVQGGIK